MKRVVSGGQTGVDRAALDVAMELGIAVGGWCPLGRLAEDGPIAGIYPLDETPSARYEQRTEWNVRDSDATLIFARGDLTGGTAYTARMAGRHRRPLLVVDPADDARLEEVRAWLATHRVEVLNVAGPRESGDRGIGDRARRFLRRLLSTPGARSSDHARGRR